MAIDAQTTLNAAHDARTGMTRAFLTGVESSVGKIKDLVSGTELPVSLVNGATRGTDARGAYGSVTGTQHIDVADTLTRPHAAFSQFVWLNNSTTSPASWAAFWEEITSGTDSLVKVQRNGSTTGLVSYCGAASNFANAMTGFPTGEIGVLLTWSGTVYTLYVTGRAGQNGAEAPVAWQFTAARTAIAGDAKGSNSWPGLYRAMAKWSRALSSAEATSVVDNPAALFVEASAGPTSIVWDPTDDADTPTAIEVEIGTPETVRIEDQAGNPVADVAVVSADTAVYTVAPATTGADGLVTITALAPGVANLTGSRAGVSNAVAAVTVPTTGSGGGEIPTAMPPTITTTSPLPAVTAGTASGVSIAISGDGPFTLDVAAGALPAGLALPAGMPLPSPIALPWTGSAGGGTSASFTLRATGPDGAQDSKAFSLPINAAAAPTPTVTGVTFDPASPQTIANGASLQVTPTVVGANNPAQTGTWSKISGMGSVTQAGNVATIAGGTTAGQGVYRFIPTADTEQSFDFTVTVQAAAQAGTRTATIPALTRTPAGAVQSVVAANLTGILCAVVDDNWPASGAVEHARLTVGTDAQGNAALTGLPSTTPASALAVLRYTVGSDRYAAVVPITTAAA